MFLYNCVNNKGHILRLSGVFVSYTYANRTYSNAGQDSWGFPILQHLQRSCVTSIAS